ncbi:major facilitator superfamily domain-containing protein [Pterulicium gracile]|uniref:Major facilitator superfamily domain-containing protein n=1 Tax=Pterulicium gracile TaxID=1884261 RepID=A0A5C3Q9W7_9AGAR|nr:major facilitator superfamily domain-containing protein [Pterula gracilis]
MAPYFLRNLIPKKEADQSSRSLLTILGSLTKLQWAMFISGWLAWTCDGIDFFSVSLSIHNLAEDFNRSTHTITTSITLTLLFRSIGAIIFGVISDRYGRKWPLVFNLLLIAVLELGAGFVTTYQQFLALRSIFGIGMGGIWGMSAATALEDLPTDARGIASGVLQQGYAVGYLIAAIINLYLVPATPHGWRALFWMASGLSFGAAAIRACLPETAYFQAANAEAKREEEKKRERGEEVMGTRGKTRTFLRETGRMLRIHWARCIYGVLLMSGFNFLSHGSQDLYPTYLQDTKGFSPHNATVATIISNVGAICGGCIAGWASQHLGRRLTIIICVLFLGAFIPLWILPDTFSPLSAGAFFVQVGVQGAWGVVPIFLSEISPPAFRVTFPGVAYQLGNMVSSASAQIEATAGESLRTELVVNGEVREVPDYAKVQGIFIGCVAAYLIVVTIFGPENHGSHFEQHKAAFSEGAAREDGHFQGEPSTSRPKDDPESSPQLGDGSHSREKASSPESSSVGDDEKGRVSMNERV